MTIKLEVYDEPDKSAPVVIGGDPAGDPGSDTVSDDSEADRDHFSVTIMDAMTTDLLAEAHGRAHPYEVADFMMDMGLNRFKTNAGPAFLSWDAMNHGISITNRFLGLDTGQWAPRYPVHRLYRHEDPETGRPTKHYGYLLKGGSRDKLIDTLVWWFNKIVGGGKARVPSIRWLKEAEDFVHTGKRIEGKPHDDRMFSTGLCLMSLRQMGLRGVRERAAEVGEKPELDPFVKRILMESEGHTDYDPLTLLPLEV